jgi:membrane-associated protease RseP (regulator of RpoE activity)
MTQAPKEPVEGPTAPTPTEHPDASGRDEKPQYETGGLRMAILAGLLLYVGFFHGWSWVLIIAGLVVMIFLHELGHFLTARWTGMKATEFFIGFGPKIWSFRRGETEYGLKVIPAGAYVRIIGMNNIDEVDAADEPRTYRQQSFPKRLLVVSAGSLMHLLQALVIAVVLLVVVGMPGGTLVPDEEAWRVEEVTPGSAAAAADLEPGDRIVAWDGEPVGGFPDITDAVRASEVGDEVTLTVQRDGETFDVTTELVDRGAAELGGWFVADVPPESPADAAGLQEGDVIVAWDGEDVKPADTVQELATTSGVGDEVTLTVERDEEELETSFEVTDTSTVAELRDSFSDAAFLGVRAELPPDETVGFVQGLAQAPADTVKLVGQAAEAIPGGVSDLFSAAFGERDATPADERQPVPGERAEGGETDGRLISIIGAVRIGASGLDVQGLLALFFIINVFIGLLNMAPLVPLDGGHAAVAIYERIRSRGGRRYYVDFNKLLPVAYAVIMVLLFVGITAMYLDIVDPVQL